MGVDGAGQHFEFEVPVGVGRDDPRDGRVGVVTSDDDVATGDGHGAGPGVFQASPEPPVVGHVHEIDGEVVVPHRETSVGQPTREGSARDWGSGELLARAAQLADGRTHDGHDGDTEHAEQVQ